MKAVRQSRILLRMMRAVADLDKKTTSSKSPVKDRCKSAIAGIGAYFSEHMQGSEVPTNLDGTKVQTTFSGGF